MSLRHPTCADRPAGPTRRAVSWAVAVAIGLGGCSAPAPQQQITIGLRNPTVPLAGTSRFDAGRLAGDWQTLACLGTCAQAPRYAVGGDGIVLRTVEGVQDAFAVQAPGVLRAVADGRRLVVMWMDEGFRTAAVGDADGTWAAVIDRGRGSPDRTAAAIEILDFNGWDVSQIKRVK